VLIGAEVVAVAVGEVGSEDVPVMGDPESGEEGGVGLQEGMKVKCVSGAGLGKVVDGAGYSMFESE